MPVVGARRGCCTSGRTARSQNASRAGSNAASAVAFIDREIRVNGCTPGRLVSDGMTTRSDTGVPTAAPIQRSCVVMFS